MKQYGIMQSGKVLNDFFFSSYRMAENAIREIREAEKAYDIPETPPMHVVCREISKWRRVEPIRRKG